MRIVVVGCGVAGVNAAITLRKSSPDADISVYTEENHLYYPRPRLYEVVSGEKEPLDLYGFKPQFYESQRIKVYLKQKVVNIDPIKKELTFEDHSKTSWDKLLLASGANPFIPPIKGVKKNGVFALRTMADALLIRERLKKTSKAIVIGAGLLGLELAASLKKAGQAVDVVGLYPSLLPKQLDQDGSEILIQSLEALGINPVLNSTTEEILGKDEVNGISLQDGRILPGGIVVIAAGVRSNIEFASAAGIKTSTGVIVDQHLKTTVNDVYAAGDVIEFNGEVYGTIPAALEQAKIAALNMLGKEDYTYKGTVHATSLRIAGISLTSMGLVDPEGSRYEEIRRADRREGIYKKIVLDQGRIVGAIFLGDREGIPTIRRLMEQGTDVTKYKDELLEGTSRE